MERAEIHELSAAYALDALDPAEREAFEQHLARCAECREAVAGFQDAAADLAYDADAPAPPPALRERILVEARGDGSNAIRFPRRRWLAPVAAAAAVAAGVAALALSFWAADLSQQLDEQRAALHLSEEAVAVLADPMRRASRSTAPKGCSSWTTSRARDGSSCAGSSPRPPRRPTRPG